MRFAKKLIRWNLIEYSINIFSLLLFRFNLMLLIKFFQSNWFPSYFRHFFSSLSLVVILFFSFTFHIGNCKFATTKNWRKKREQTRTTLFRCNFHLIRFKRNTSEKKHQIYYRSIIVWVLLNSFQKRSALRLLFSSNPWNCSAKRTEIPFALIQ